MSREKLFLQKGESIAFLDYTITNSPGNDGLVLCKMNGLPYEIHLGNYGSGTQAHVDSCKRFAILFFMVARPEVFASTIANKMWRINSGTMHEYYKLKRVCELENIIFSNEIECGDSGLIFFKGMPLAPIGTELPTLKK